MSFLHAFHSFVASIQNYPEIQKCKGCDIYRIYNITSSLDEGDWYEFSEKELPEIKRKVDEVYSNRKLANETRRKET
jgi:hypothetical protein